MTKNHSTRVFSTPSSQSGWKTLIFALFTILLTTTYSCSDNDDETDNDQKLICTIESYNEFGAGMLSITEADMTKAGFSLGDVISIDVAGKTIVMPYYDGYYTFDGEYVCVAYPTYPSICFTVNNKGLPEELQGREGQTVIIRMKEKGGKIDVQKALSMKYTNDRNNYLSDEAFANARMVTGGNIASGVLHRSSTPFSNEIGRANYVADYLEKNHVKTVLNLADTEEKMLGYDMPVYSRTLWEGNNVILCPLKQNPTVDDYNNRLIEALKDLSKREPPYVVHCQEGKDRTGYVCAFLEGLCGASYDEIAADYLKTYENFYKITPEKDPAVCNALLTLRLNWCLMYYTNADDEAQLPDIDYAEALSNYLLAHGMIQPEIDALIEALTTPMDV